MDKFEAYIKLVVDRKGCRLCMTDRSITKRYLNQSELPDIVDEDHIGNFSTWAHDLNARVVIVGQDYADVETYKRDQGRVQLCPITVDAPVSCWSTETNYRLRQLVLELGLDIGSPSVGSGDSGVFLTNAVLCLKPGKMSDPNPAKVYANCAERFLRRTINVVEPEVVIALGLQAARATMLAFSKDNPQLGPLRKLSMKALHSMGGIVLNSKSSLYAVYHPGAFGRMARQRVDPDKRDGWQLQLEDWRSMKRAAVPDMSS